MFAFFLFPKYNTIERGDFMDNIETIQKTIKFPIILHEKLLNDANKLQRDFTKQVIYIIKKYYENKEE